MNNIKSLKTGDAILFSGNTGTGFLLRTFVSMDWNHSGIAVRFITLPDNSKEVSLTTEGELYIFETNSGARFDSIQMETLKGAAFSPSEWVFSKYNRAIVRRLHDSFRTKELAISTMNFAIKSKGIPFPNSSLPFLSIWLGIPLATKNNDPTMFCSELMAHYYTYTIGKQYHQITGVNYDNKLSTIFGSECPSTEDMFTPGDFSYHSTPSATIFNNNDEIVFSVHADLIFVILQPFLIIMVFILFLWMILPH